MSFAIRISGRTRSSTFKKICSSTSVFISRRTFSSSSIIPCLQQPSRWTCNNHLGRTVFRRNFSTKPATSHQYAESEDEDHRTPLEVQQKPVSRVINIKVPNQLTVENAIKSTASPKDNNILNEQGDIVSKIKDLKGHHLSTQNFTVFCKDPYVTFDVKLGDKTRRQTFLIPNGTDVIEINLEREEELRENGGAGSQAVQEQGWQQQKLDLAKLPRYYMNLSKIRLTVLVVLTTMSGYALAPDPFILSTFAFCTFGTALTSCAANSINQFLEVPYDSQMNRTKNRVLVRNHISPLHAVTFASVAGSTGLAVLYFGANPLTAALGAFNLGLYTMVYTPMKRHSIANTWLGSVVGAIPPVMGWTACTGMMDPGAWLLGAILYAWQFPHFNALSWNLRPDYSRGGYRMASVIDPDLCKRVALRHSIGIVGLSMLAPLAGITTTMFIPVSLPINLYCTYLAWNFYRQGDSNTSRKLFRFSLIHIPALLGLMLLCKKRTTPDGKQPSEIAEAAQSVT